MRISYDTTYDTLYIKLVEGHHQVFTKHVNDDVALDYGDAEQVVGIEILNARVVLNHGVPLSLSVENLPVSSSSGPPDTQPMTGNDT